MKSVLFKWQDDEQTVEVALSIDVIPKIKEHVSINVIVSGEVVEFKGRVFDVNHSYTSNTYSVVPVSGIVVSCYKDIKLPRE